MRWSSQHHRAEITAMTSNIRLPDDLEETVIAQFDKLVEAGKIFYKPTKPESVTHNGFEVRQYL